MRSIARIVSGLFLAALALGCAKNADTPQPMTEKASIRYQFAYDAFSRGELIEALGAALDAEKLSPNNPDTKNLLGLIYFRQGKFQQAEESFLRGSALNPKLSEIHNNLGTLYYQMKDYPKAEEALRRALVNPLYLYPERIYNNLGLVQQALNQRNNAINSYEKSIELKSDFFLPYQNLGKLYLEMGESKKAKNLLERASHLCAQCAEPRYHLGTLFMKENQASEALKNFKKGAELDPNGYYGQLCKEFLTKKE